MSVANAYEDPRPHAVRERYLALFGGSDLPVRVAAIAEDLLGLHVEERPGLAMSGVLLPAERRVILNADEVPARRRFTLAHELGHWVCQVQAGHRAPLYCRVEDLAMAADRTLEREANVFAAELLMPEPAVRAAWSETLDVETCAMRFDVSPSAMQWRLYSFDLVEERPA